MLNGLTRRRMHLLAATALAASWAIDPAAAEDPIRIGYAGALTGPAAFTGLDIRRGAEMAIEAINAEGGVQGRPLELVSRDDEHNPVKTVAAYRELVEREGVVAMLGATNSASMLAVAPIVNDELKVPVVCPATDATAITENAAWEEGRDNYIFRLGMYGRGQANFLVDSMIDKFGLEKIGLLTWTAGWGVTGRQEILRRLDERGLEAVADETYDTADADMTPQILKLQSAGAEAVLNYGLVRENTFVVNTKKKLGDTTPYASAWGLAGPSFWKAAGDAGEGVLTSTTITIDGPQSEERVALLADYRERYNQEIDAPTSVYAAYDIVHLLALVMEEVGTEPDAIRAGLETVESFTGLVKDFDRPVFTRERHDALTEADMVLGRWTEGQLLEVQVDDQGPFVVLDSGDKKYIDPKTMALK